MIESEFIQLLKDIKNQVIQEKSLEIIVRNVNGDLIDEDTIIIDNVRAIALAEALKFNPYITHLNLNHNDIGDTGAIALAEITTLKKIELYGNQIGVNGAVALIRNNLENLVLGGNILHHYNISETLELVEALINNHTIKNLDFECCLFSDQLVNRLITGNDTLTTINLSYNNLTDAALESIHLNKSLKTLHLAHNNITDIAIGYIVNNTNLVYINLAHNNITINGAQQFIGSNLSRVEFVNDIISIREVNLFNQIFEKAKKLKQDTVQEKKFSQIEIIDDSKMDEDETIELIGNPNNNDDHHVD